jgi:hypothetical protein
MHGGFRNTMTMVLTGLDIQEKAAHAEQLLFRQLGGREQYAQADVRLLRFDRPDAVSNEEATAHLRVTVKDPDEAKVGRAFSDVTWELALGGYAGFHTTTPPTPASAFGVYWPALVQAAAVRQIVHLPDGQEIVVPPAAGVAGAAHGLGTVTPTATGGAPARPDGPLVRVPLGRIAGARSGDKGGNANVGLWARTEAQYEWMHGELTVEAFRALLPEASSLAVRRYELPNLRALNFVIEAILAPGVAATVRPDAQAKGLGEYLRSRTMLVPESLLQSQAGLAERGPSLALDTWLLD